MIRSDCYSREWIQKVSDTLHYPDVNLIEKVIRAFSLVELLSASGCPVTWKGGTALMLLLSGARHRLSIDVDVICPPGTDIEAYLKDYRSFGFLDVETVERIQRGTNFCLQPLAGGEFLLLVERTTLLFRYRLIIWTMDRSFGSGMR